MWLLYLYLKSLETDIIMISKYAGQTVNMDQF